ncbi:MAG: STAS domain-containing protein [Actinobacteria bacterium]|nr:STAS domain-containing protein [Actinomycetota bacterium]
MEITKRVTADGVAVLLPVGKLNMVHAHRLREVVDSVLADGQNRIVVDLSSVDFLDSSGLGALIGCLKAARQANGDLRIAAATEQVKLVLQLTNLDRVLTPYASAESAYVIE